MAIVAVAGFILSDKLSTNSPGWLTGIRMAEYRAVSSIIQGTVSRHNVAVVLIDDNAYYSEILAHRRPLKRDYLGKLITATCAQNPRVVGLDIYTRSPVDGNSSESPDYQSEDQALFEAIDKASSTCTIVLGRTLRPDKDGLYAEEMSILDGFSFSNKNNVVWGYISLPADPRRVPVAGTFNVKNKTLDSFSQAIARVVDQSMAAGLTGQRGLPFGVFATPQKFESDKLVFSADNIINAKQRSNDLAHKVVLIGGSWHEQSLGVGPIVDTHPSPVGAIPGVFLHANYIAAMLTNGGTFGDAPEGVKYAFEIAVILCIAFIYSRSIATLYRWMALGAIVVVVAFITYVCRQNIGLYFEGTIPSVLVVVHGIIDEEVRVREKLSEALAELKTLRMKSGV